MKNQHDRLVRRLVVVAFVLFALPAMATPIEPGEWYQTSSTAGDCAGCFVEVHPRSPHTVEVHASNGWVAFLQYVPEAGVYTGFLELVDGDPDAAPTQMGARRPDWRMQVFAVEAFIDHGVVNIIADSGQNAFHATYRRR